MIDDLMGIKDDAMKQLEKRVDEGRLERMDVKELADVVKDLAEAAQACSTVEAMQSYGYMPDDMGYGDGQGYGSRGGSRGYNRNRDSMGRYTSRGRRGYGSYGYHEHVDGLREQMQNASQEEREQMKREIREMLGM